MELWGIQFAPLNVPLARRLQTLAAAAWFITMAFGGFLGLFLALYLLFFTQFWWMMLIYLIWIWKFDNQTCEKEGRRNEWVRGWTWWRYFRDYFPARLERVPWAELDPSRNYLFCSFPHGMLATGMFSAFGTNCGGYKDLFPHHTPIVATLSQHYNMPFFRELALALGGCSASSTALNFHLGWPGGGRVVVLMPGGAAEAYYCRPGQYRVLVKRRKGFIKLALRNGSPLVPLISFGETDLFGQVEGERLHRIQEFFRKYIGMAPVIPVGRGFFQYSFGIIPRRRPVTTVVGKPIDVEKVENPTQEQIDGLHQKFVEELINLFEEQKHLYLKNYENVHLNVD